MRGNTKHLVFSVCVAFVLCAFASVASARTIYVPDDYARIQWAIDNASYGDTIIVRDGIYYESITVNKQLTIKSENGPENCIVNGSGSDVFTLKADGIRIEGFTITGGWDGIHILSNNNTIINNIISSNNYHGIFLDESNNNSISNNIISSNKYGIDLLFSDKNTIRENEFINNGLSVPYSYGNIVEDNKVNGKPLVYLEDESDKFIDNAGQVILVRCKNITIMNSELTNTDVGIELFESDNCLISNNNISSNNHYGIYLSASNNNSISNNKICSNNFYGIFLSGSKNNSISNNIICSNNYYGIELWYSKNNKIINNQFIKDGLRVYELYDNIVEDNKVNGKPLVYLEEESDKFINNAGQIILVRCSNITVVNAELTNTDVGIELLQCNNCLISNNNISSNYHDGIYLRHSNNNSISNNNISNNWRGIFLYNSINNIICLNNFIDNAENAYSHNSTNFWNSTSQITYTYKGRTYTNYMGNYWSDYEGSDADEDGIGDTPYSIDSDKDNYPLIERFENYFVPMPIPTPAQTFDTGRPENPYPSISGKFVGTIKTNKEIIVKKLYTYACEGTGGHTEYAIICNDSFCAEAKWEGYKGDWMNISFNRTVVLMPYETYNITIVTGSYPQIHHTSSLKTENGWINCTEFTDANGNKYEDWIPAIKLWS